MAQEPLSDEKAQAAYDAWVRNDRSHAAAAAELGIPVRTFQNHLTIAKERGIGIDPAIQAGMAALGLNAQPGGGWIKSHKPDENGLTYSFTLPKQTQESIDEQIATATAAAIARIEAATPFAPTLIRPKAPDPKLFGFLGLFDAHLALSMPGYDLEKSVKRFVEASVETIDAMPSAETIVIVQGGDLTHQNDNSNQTPAHKHSLPISANYLNTTDAATDARIAIIEHAARKFDRVETKDLEGNHDPATAMIVRSALRQRYREHERIVVDLDGVEFWDRIWGNNLLTAHHGDIKRAPKDIVLNLQERYRVPRGKAAFHEHHFGHTHHIKETRLNMGGVHLCQHSAISRKSNHDFSNLYESDSVLFGITYKFSGGRHSTMEIQLD